MDEDSREPDFKGLTKDIDTFFYETELRLGHDDGLKAISAIATEIFLVNGAGKEVVDIRKRRDGLYNMYVKLDDGTRVVVVPIKQPDGIYSAKEGGVLWN